MTLDAKPELIQSVVRAARLLLWLAAHDEATASEAAAAMGWPVPTTYHLLNTLLAEGLVSKDDRKRYSMGFRVAALSDAFLRRESVPPEVRDGLEWLAATTGESAYLLVWRGFEIRVLDSVEGPQAVRVGAINTGPYSDAHARAAGKLLLAHATPQRRERYLTENPVRKVTKHTIRSERALEAHFEEILEQGYAVDVEEFVDDVACVAAAISVRGDLVAAYAVSAPVHRYLENREALIAGVRAACLRTEKALSRQPEQRPPVHRLRSRSSTPVHLPQSA